MSDIENNGVIGEKYEKDTLLKEVEKCYLFKDQYKKLLSNYQNVIILGNGGSSSIASHITQDYTKKLCKRSFYFLRCFSPNLLF